MLRLLLQTLLTMIAMAGCEPGIPNYLESADSPAECTPPKSYHVTLKYRDPTNDCTEQAPDFIGCMRSVEDPDLPPGSSSSLDLPSPVRATRGDGMVMCAAAYGDFRYTPVEEQTYEGLYASDTQGAWLWLRNAIARGLLDGRGSRGAPEEFTADQIQCYPEFFDP